MFAKLLRVVGIEEDPNKIDLRYFRTMVLADTYDGLGVAHNGVSRNLLYYDGRLVYESSVMKDYGATEGRKENGDMSDFYKTMHRISQNYIKIVYRAMQELGNTDKKVPCTLRMTLEELEILQNHPQFTSVISQLVEQGYKLELLRTDSPINVSNEDEYLIEVKNIKI